MTSGTDILALESWVSTALAQLAPAARKKLFREIGTELRRRTRTRMARQTGPDGEAWPARARDAGRKVRSKVKMMQGLRETRRLLLNADPQGLELGWAGTTARIASVHQEGDTDYVDRSQSTQQVRYPIRRLIGLPADDVDFVRTRLLDALTRG